MVRATAQPVSGLCDIHCHGGGGASFGPDVSANRTAARFHRDHGTADVVASLVSAPVEQLVASVRGLAPLVADGEVIGIHIEGPFLAARRCGAHDAAALRAPDVGLVEAVLEAATEAGADGAIKQWTLAPELEGAADLAGRLAGWGVVPALGHTDADAATFAAALDAVGDALGRPPLVTHLFNAMPPFHHRSGGPVAVALSAAARQQAIVELIGDGIHVAPETVRMVFDCVGPSQIALVSDAICASGAGDGAYHLGTRPIEVIDGVARTDTGAIAGSTSTLSDVVDWVSTVAGVSRSDAVAAASDTPRRALAIED